MHDDLKTKQDLISEVKALQARIAELEASTADREKMRPESLFGLRFNLNLINSVPVPVFYKDARGVYTGCNPAFERFIGLDKKDIIGRTMYDIAPKHLADIYHQKDRELFEKPGLQVYETEVRSASGDLRKVIFHKATFSRTESSVDGLIGVIIDITEQKRTEKILKEERNIRQQYLDVADVILVALDTRQNLTMINRKGCEVLGYHKSELIGKNWFDIVIESTLREKIKSAYHQGITGKLELVEHMENPVITKTGEKRTISWHNTVLKNDNGHIAGLLGSGRDITDQLHTLRDLRESEDRLRRILNSLQSGIVIIDPDTHRIVDINPATIDMLGTPREKIIGSVCHDFICPWEKGRCPITDKGETIDRAERVIIRPDGREIPVIKSVSTVKFRGRPHLVEMFLDISERKRLEKKLEELSVTDQLTGLQNRRGFMALAEQQLKVADRTRKGLALSFLDLDGLKQINDRLGHEAGDQAIVDAADTLRKTFRGSDIISRLGGDEFAVLALESSGAQPDSIIRRLRKNIDAHNASAKRTYTLSISIGTVLYDPETPRSLDQLMAEADRLMYREKHGKRP